MTVYGDGTQTRDYLFVEDLTDGIVQAVRAGVMGVYQLGYGVPVSVNELIDVIRSVTGRDFKVSYEPARAGEILHTHCDIAKASGAFDYAPKVTLAEGVERTWAWFEEEGYPSG